MDKSPSFATWKSLASNLMPKGLIKKVLLILILLNLSRFLFSQKTDSMIVAGHFGGSVTVTNNGISFIPNFTLGKPAAIFELSVGKGKLSFEPQFRFALEGKPWSIVFWWRYRLLKTEKLQITIGAHPALAFKTMTLTSDSLLKKYIVTQRYLAAELAPYYFITKNISFGIYYFYGHGIDKDAVKYTHMLSARTNFSFIRLSGEFFMRFYPQVYYLKMEEKDGFYFSSSLTLARTDFPVSISAMINTPINTNISAGNKFIWNASLIYTFNREYVKK